MSQGIWNHKRYVQTKGTTMTDKLKCPFCGEELEKCSYLSKGITNPVFVSRNRKCKFANKIIDSEIWQALIDGKKAQRQLRTVKDRCVKKVKAKEREIANYLNGINVRNKEIETLHKQLQKAQDALKVAIDALSKIDTFDCQGKGAMEIIARMASIANGALYEITSITKQEE